jgi:hypothetical protein
VTDDRLADLDRYGKASDEAVAQLAHSRAREHQLCTLLASHGVEVVDTDTGSAEGRFRLAISGEVVPDGVRLRLPLLAEVPWWIVTDDGEKVLGPFVSRDLAIDVRLFVEAARKPATYAVQQIPA